MRAEVKGQSIWVDRHGDLSHHSVLSAYFHKVTPVHVDYINKRPLLPLLKGFKCYDHGKQTILVTNICHIQLGSPDARLVHFHAIIIKYYWSRQVELSSNLNAL